MSVDDPFSVDRDAVLALIRDNPGALDKREIGRSLRLGAEQKIALKRLLRALEGDGEIQRAGRRGYRLTGAVPAKGVIEIVGQDEDGELLARLVSPANAEARIRVRPGRGGALGAGDRAVAALRAYEDGWFEARIVARIGKADADALLGRVRQSTHGWRITPVNKRARHELAVRTQDLAGAKDGDLVRCRLERDRRDGLRMASVVEVIGGTDTAAAATLIALAEHNVPMGFSPDEDAQARDAKPATAKGREDLTGLPLITIDPADARDHDDAVWAAPDDDADNTGGWIVMVAIADVAAYVRPGSPLDAGALERANSVYFPDRVVPMLPERLSTDLCSLREGEARPCLAVRMVFDAGGDKASHAFVRGWMRSAAKLTYEQAQAAIDGKPDAAAAPLLDDVLRPLWSAYAAVSKARRRRAPLDIDAPERRISLNADGQVSGVSVNKRFDAHKLIEEFMILANVCAAETLEKKRQPLIYRVHDAPAREKIEALSDFLPEVGLRWSKGERATPKRFNALLAKARGGNNAEIVADMVLRTQSQAIYTPDNIGHFGLNVDRYAHFTSPIRRYADLVVHRALITGLNLGEDGLADGDDHRLHAISERISTAERRAMAAERDACDRYLAAFLAGREGASFSGRITGLTRAGLFVRLDETGADGFVPISFLGEERFRHDPRAHALIGEATGGRYRLGQRVEARLEEATPLTGGLLLTLMTPPQAGPKPARGRGRSDSRPPRGRKRRRR